MATAKDFIFTSSNLY